MTEKRFTYDEFEDCIIDNLTGKTHWGLDDILNDKLNELHENQQYKVLLQDMGLLMFDEDVMSIRSEIADKIIKPICKENGFDVDVDYTNGFTIIPKDNDGMTGKQYPICFVCVHCFRDDNYGVSCTNEKCEYETRFWDLVLQTECEHFEYDEVWDNE